MTHCPYLIKHVCTEENLKSIIIDKRITKVKWLLIAHIEWSYNHHPCEIYDYECYCWYRCVDKQVVFDSVICIGKINTYGLIFFFFLIFLGFMIWRSQKYVEKTLYIFMLQLKSLRTIIFLLLHAYKNLSKVNHKKYYKTFNVTLANKIFVACWGVFSQSRMFTFMALLILI